MVLRRKKITEHKKNQKKESKVEAYIFTTQLNDRAFSSWLVFFFFFNERLTNNSFNIYKKQILSLPPRINSSTVIKDVLTTVLLQAFLGDKRKATS